MTPFTPAWLAREPSATAFLPCAYADPAARTAAVAAAAERRADPAVLDRLHVTTDAQARARDRLAQAGTVAVVTGQQAGLFGGPLYTVYKAVSAIANARALAEQTGRDCVPVFWIQNEDHDYDEIATATVLGPDGRLHDVTLPAREEDRDRSIAVRRLGEGVAHALAAVEDCLQGLSGVGPVMDLLRAHYRPDSSPDASFRGLIDAWFGEHGLLVLDPTAVPAPDLHQRAVREAAPIARALQDRAGALQEAGYAVQVHVRPGAPLSFFHPDGTGGPRYRIEPHPDGFRLVGTERVVAPDAVLNGTCSTSALLRPILQDLWLPTAAIVGGPGEVAYFAQMPPLYAHFGLPLPLIVPRARFQIRDETTDRLFSQLALTGPDAERPRDELLARLARDEPALTEWIRAAQALDETFAALGPPASALDPGLGKAVQKAAESVSADLRRLADRYRRTLAQRDEVTIDRLERLLARWRPRGAPQERIWSWPWVGARYGIQAFVDGVLSATVPFDGALRELRL